MAKILWRKRAHLVGRAEVVEGCRSGLRFLPADEAEAVRSANELAAEARLLAVQRRVLRDDPNRTDRQRLDVYEGDVLALRLVRELAAAGCKLSVRQLADRTGIPRFRVTYLMSWSWFRMRHPGGVTVYGLSAVGRAMLDTEGGWSCSQSPKSTDARPCGRVAASSAG